PPTAGITSSYRLIEAIIQALQADRQGWIVLPFGASSRHPASFGVCAAYTRKVKLRRACSACGFCPGNAAGGVQKRPLIEGPAEAAANRSKSMELAVETGIIKTRGLIKVLFPARGDVYIALNPKHSLSPLPVVAGVEAEQCSLGSDA